MPIEIVPPREDWPRRFRDVGGGLRSTLGDLAVRIDHIGSTAVPGLAAKDVIDVQVTVAALDEAALRPALESRGLGWRADITRDHLPPGREMPPQELHKFYASAPGLHCHVRVEGRFNQRYPILCRDYLRAHPSAAAAYAEVKRQLARRFADDVESYYDVKDPVCDLIMEGAYEWSERTNWSPGPTDA